MSVNAGGFAFRVAVQVARRNDDIAARVVGQIAVGDKFRVLSFYLGLFAVFGFNEDGDFAFALAGWRDGEFADKLFLHQIAHLFVIFVKDVGRRHAFAGQQQPVLLAAAFDLNARTEHHSVKRIERTAFPFFVAFDDDARRKPHRLAANPGHFAFG